MEINMKDKLRSLRQQKNITQETLANYLGITSQSVGKWERGEGFPDITLLPALAMYFNVTVDDLLDVGKARIEEKVRQYREQSNILSNHGEVQQEYELWEKAYAEFPNNEDVIYSRMYALHGVYNQETDPEKKKEISDAIFKMGEKLLHSDDIDKRSGAVQVLAYHSKDIDRNEDAVRYARMGTSHWVTADEILATVLDGDEAVLQCQSNIMELIDLTVRNAYAMQWKSDKYTHEEKAEINRFCLKLMELYFHDGNYLFFNHRMWEFNSYLSYELAELGRWDECLEAVEKAAGFAISADTLPEGDVPYTSLLMNMLKYNGCRTASNSTDNNSAHLLKSLKHKRFDGVRDNARFTAVIAELEKYAGKN